MSRIIDREKECKKGFTIIELSLSIAFISILSITVVLIITDTVSSYRRGLTLNQINTAGMDIVDDIRSSIQNSSARSIAGDCGNIYENDADCVEDNARTFALVERDARVIVVNEDIGEVPVYGAFCTGNYSYLWNSGYFFSDDASVNALEKGIVLKYKNSANEVEVSDFKLLKIKDIERRVCKAVATSGEKYMSLDAVKSGMSNEIDISNGVYIDEEPTEILARDNNLALYDLTTAVPAESDNNRNTFYSISFILGTVQGGINVKSAGNYCATPGGYNSEVENFDYCTINKFNFAAQATGG